MYRLDGILGLMGLWMSQSIRNSPERAKKAAIWGMIRYTGEFAIIRHMSLWGGCLGDTVLHSLAIVAPVGKVASRIGGG